MQEWDINLFQFRTNSRLVMMMVLYLFLFIIVRVLLVELDREYRFDLSNERSNIHLKYSKSNSKCNFFHFETFTYNVRQMCILFGYFPIVVEWFSYLILFYSYIFMYFQWLWSIELRTFFMPVWLCEFGIIDAHISKVREFFYLKTIYNFRQNKLKLLFILNSNKDEEESRNGKKIGNGTGIAYSITILFMFEHLH